MSHICTISLSYSDNASNIIFFHRNRCTGEFDGAILWPKCPNHVVFEGCNMCLQEDSRVPYSGQRGGSSGTPQRFLSIALRAFEIIL